MGDDIAPENWNIAYCKRTNGIQDIFLTSRSSDGLNCNHKCFVTNRLRQLKSYILILISSLWDLFFKSSITSISSISISFFIFGLSLSNL